MAGMGEREEEGRSGGRGEGAAEEVGAAEWERCLPRTPVRVLVVEGDDSTRQVIAALLRKCSYRVVAASDGLKAWEILKEGAHDIDLVLTEVQLPLVSGFVLLSMIMDHETCRHIPVIMMSSHHSISMVFKCVLKGAADFLVKPIRKNELRNLWQHVWRRNSSTGGPCSIYSHENHAKRKFKANGENNAINHSSEFLAYLQKSKDNREKASDAQSSCTRSDMEVESTYVQNMQEPGQQKCTSISLMDHGIAQKGAKHMQSGSEFVMVENEEDNSSTLFSEKTPCNEVCHSNELMLEDNSGVVKSTVTMEAIPKSHMDYNAVTTAENGRTDDQEKHSQETINLIGSMNSDPQCNHELRENTDFPSPSKFLTFENKAQSKLVSTPFLELSLRIQQCNSSDKKANEGNTLNHSNSSPFSLYTSKTVPPTSSTPLTAVYQSKQYDTSAQTLYNEDSGNGGSIPQCNDATVHANEEEARLQDALSCIDGTTIRPSNPSSFSIMWEANGQPMHYPLLGHSLWSSAPNISQEAVQQSLSCLSDHEKLETVQSNHQDGRSIESFHKHHSQRQDENMEVVDEQRLVSSATCESGNLSICNNRRNHPDTNGSGSFCFAGNGNIAGPNISKAPIESKNGNILLANEGFKSTDFHLLNQREAALTKFRLKRKDRCYEKKVRYQSRKKLAEQRPRVKGQFVRISTAE